MAIKLDPDDLNQGSSLAVAGAIYATGTGADIRIHTSAANNLPALAASEFFEVREHSDTVNNGLFQVVTVNTSTDDYECDKVFGSAPIVAGAEAITTLGATGASTEKSIFFNTADFTTGIALLEQGNLDVDGVTGQAVYSRALKDWKDDNFLGAFDFPMLTIDADAGKFVIGQDNQGNSNGWNWADSTPFSIRTRKLLRNAGWDEISSAGIRTAGYVGFGTLGAFEDTVNDKARYQFGNDTTVDDTVEFDFADAVNEAVRFYQEIGNPPTCAFTTSTITRVSGSFVTDGYKVGGQVTIRTAEDVGNNGSFVLTAVAALTLTGVATPFTANAADTTAQLSVDNSNLVQLRLRVRDGDTNGKTYGQAFLSSGNYTVLRSGFMTFPLANKTDVKISETDANIDANTPYTGMTLTFHATPQSLGADLVGGPYDFGFALVANNGTDVEVFEWLQRQLRKATDIDAGAGTNIGLTMDDMAAFVGDKLDLGTPDGGLSFPTNPEGGGSGVYITGLNAASKNNTSVFDNTGARRGFPVGSPVIIDINQIFIDDTSAEMSLYFDRTIRTTVSDLIITAGTGANGTFDSAGANLPVTLDQGVGAYVRITGLTGADADMNGTYQVTALTSTSQWNVTKRNGATIVTTTVASLPIDENCINTPDAILVNTDNALTATTLSFTAPDILADSGSGLAVFPVGAFVRIEGTTSTLNDGIFEVAVSTAAQLDFVEQTIVTQAAGPSVTVTQVFKHAADADFSATFDYSSNVQGGRSSGTDAQVQAKGGGAAVDGAQVATSAVATVQSAVTLTIVLSASLERNFTP